MSGACTINPALCGMSNMKYDIVTGGTILYHLWWYKPVKSIHEHITMPVCIATLRPGVQQ